MRRTMQHLTRRTFVRLAGAAISSRATPFHAEDTEPPIPLFDGKTLNGWLQIENDATSLSSGDISDQSAFLARLANGSDPVSTFLRAQLDATVKADVAAFSATSPNAKPILSELVKGLNQVISGPSIYDATRFQGIHLRPETRQLLSHNDGHQELARLNKLLLEDAYPSVLATSVTEGWTVKDGAMASNGSGRGVIYTTRDFTRYRLTFAMRHISGQPDHQASVLIFCVRPGPEEKPLDALGGIQFQVPNGGHWDYRPGKNNSGGTAFTIINKPQFDPHQWSRVELLVDATKGTARMAVAQPPDTKAIEVLSFTDPTAGKTGPIALQMHNAGLLDEYTAITIEVNSGDRDLVSPK